MRTDLFWAKVDKSGKCWLWTGHCNRNGYGRLYRHFPDPVLAHRLAWEITTGDALTSVPPQ